MGRSRQATSVLAAGAAIAFALGCAAPPALPAGAPAPPGTSPMAAAPASWPSAPPTIVHQGVGHEPRGFQVTPRGTWLVDGLFGELVIIEPETGTVVRRFPMPAIWPQLILSADARYVAALGREQDSTGAKIRWLYVWDLALGRELFHRQVAVRDDRPGGLLITPGTVHVVECNQSTLPALDCGFRAFDLATGQPRQPPPSEPPPRSWFVYDGYGDWHPGRNARFTQYSADGRLALVANSYGGTIVFRLDPPAVVTSLPSDCVAELDGAGNLLWSPKHPSYVPEAERALNGVGLRLRTLPACPKEAKEQHRSPGGRFQTDSVSPNLSQPVDYARLSMGREQWFRITRTDTGASTLLPGFHETSSIDLFPRIGVNHDLLWERATEERPHHNLLLRAARVELPRWLPAAGDQARVAPDGAIYWGPDGSGRLHTMRGDTLVESPPVPLRLPGGGEWFLDTFVPFLPDGRFLVGTAGGRFAVALGEPPKINRLPWVRITDGSTNVTFAGQRYLLVGDKNQGQLIVDLRSHRRVGVICKYEKETCSDALTTSDGESAWVIIGQRDERADRIEQISLPDGRVLASRRIQKLVWASSGSAATFQTRTGWLEPDRRFWIMGSDDSHSCLPGLNDLCVITIVDLTTDPVGIRIVNAPGVNEITPAPDSSFFAQPTPAQLGFNLFRPDGQTFLTTGVFGDGSYSVTPDGRFACAGDGCRLLRCTVNGRSEAVDHPACRMLRREGFSIDQEFARPRR